MISETFKSAISNAINTAILSTISLCLRPIKSKPTFDEFIP